MNNSNFNKEIASLSISIKARELSENHQKEVIKLEEDLAGRNMLNQGPGLRALFELYEKQLKESLETRFICILEAIEEGKIIDEKTEKEIYTFLENFGKNQVSALEVTLKQKIGRAGLSNSFNGSYKGGIAYVGNKLFAEFKNKLKLEIKKHNNKFKISDNSNYGQRWYKYIWKVVAGFGIIIGLIAAGIQVFDWFSEDIEPKVYYEIYSIGYDLSKYSSLIWEAERLKQSTSSDVLKKYGMSYDGLEKHIKLLNSEIKLTQTRFDALKLNININNILEEFKKMFLIVNQKNDVEKVMFNVYRQIHRNIVFHYNKKLADIFFIAVFCGDHSRRGIGLYEEERVAPYNELAPKINDMLSNNNYNISVKNNVDNTQLLIQELERLDFFMRSALQPEK